MKMPLRIFRTRGHAHGTTETTDGTEQQAGMQPPAHEAGGGRAPPLGILLHRALSEQSFLLSWHRHLLFCRKGPGPGPTSVAANNA